MYKIAFYARISDTVFWNNMTNIPCFENPSFLKTMVATNQTIDYKFVEITENNQLIGRLLVQLLPFQGKELKSYVSEESPCFVKATIETVLDNINWKMAVVGNLFVSGENGQYWNSNINSTKRWEILQKVSKKLKKELKVDTILFTEIREKDLEGSQLLTKNGFKLFTIEPELSLDIPLQWNTFEDYLAAMKSKYKVRTRKVYKDSRALEVKSLNAEEIAANQNIINRLHENVTKKIGFKLAEVSETYFYDLKKCQSDNFGFYAYYLNDKMIGFISTMNNHNVLEVHLIGLDYAVNKTLGLYQRILYDCIDLAIKQKKTKVNFGKTATTIKTSVGAQPSKIFALLKHNNKVSNLSIKPFFHFLKPEEEETRNPFKQTA